MTISVHFSEQAEAELRGVSRRRGQPISEFVREAVEEKLQRDGYKVDAYYLGKDLFGRYASGDGNRSTERKQLIKERIRERVRAKRGT